ncbi:helix-turn-helix domain-containing protein [Kitasatospora sp. NPDC001261]|uniref:helix-turn-helix domain-containing protein n=1 Tax=Kitasatospora sp. NPDC001261 TaxID=3364012 RepID=UPI00369BD11E
MTDFTPDTIGKRIKQTRKLRHMTQTELALKAAISASHMAQIEQGKRQASPAVVASIARALSVPVADLEGRPFIEELRRDQLDGLIQPIRESLDVFDLGADPDVAPRPIEDLVTHTDRVCRLIRASDLRSAAAELPGLITETTTAAHSTGHRRAWQALAMQYRSGYDLASKLGFQDLASISLDRMGWAAERASDAVTGAIRQYNRALAYLRAGQYRTGIRIAELARQTAAQADPGIEREAVTGQVHLGIAVLAARNGDAEAITGNLAEAESISVRTGEVPELLWLAFGPTNVAAHRASCLIDQTLYHEALKVARAIEIPDSWPASRAAHHHAEIARALLWTGKGDAAFRRLLDARRLAPQQSRHSSTVRETVAGLLRAQRRLPESLTNYASWIGM